MKSRGFSLPSAGSYSVPSETSRSIRPPGQRARAVAVVEGPIFRKEDKTNAQSQFGLIVGGSRQLKNMGINTYYITSYASMRVLGFEPRTYALKVRCSTS
jgi:hypothetical protein